MSNSICLVVVKFRVLKCLKINLLALSLIGFVLLCSCTTALADSFYSEPIFKAETVANNLREGYWIESVDVNQDSQPDLVGHGLSSGELYWYENPKWERHLMQDKITMPVGADTQDINNDGFPDYVFCYELYGSGGRIDDPNPEGGKIAWLENPGNADNAESRWKKHYVGRQVGMHRLRVGHFTRTDRWQILGLPIVSQYGVQDVLTIPLYTQPKDIEGADSWDESIIDNQHFRFVHGVQVKKGLIPNSELDSVVLASDEGVTWLYYDQTFKKWKRVLLGTGEKSIFQETEYHFKGSGNPEIGRIGNDPFAYAAAVEPFHGSTIAVYYKDEEGKSNPTEASWHRRVLDVYGKPNAEHGEGTGHHIYAADFDGDGNDEFLVALRGPKPYRGVFYYKAVDASKGLFLKWQVSTESAARIAVDDFNGDNKLDFATIGYSVKKYYEDVDPKIVVFYNQTIINPKMNQTITDPKMVGVQKQDQF
ncbi:hypothetical protein NG798_25470 [Ancylothrix sp. C2]|uniref:hypothetical protein n=1 Tax=Ancylothrix sp. D3o TaxID=2953691 RepID=UPI0021BAB149|nr:hypothetical protein [Ancylothrix sp. D3o]MCT7953153.1 hypothetical protein [Ancylothrix sp. D3o]